MVKQFKLSKQKWFNESTLVDILNLVLVLMNSSIKFFGLNARLVICMQGQIVYLVENKDK